jgi:ABC-type uncharacterized transport system substrate-binding protein
MDRRRFLLTSMAGALAAPVAVEAQLPATGRQRIALISAEGDPAVLGAFAAEMRELGCVEGQSTAVILAAKQPTATIPIVMGSSGDAVAAGLVRSLSRPGGNTPILTSTRDVMAGGPRLADDSKGLRAVWLR